MKNSFAFWGMALALLPLLASCGERMQEAKNAYSAVATTTKAAEKMGEAMNKAEAKRKLRAAHGDTISLHYKELEKYLPGSIEGFTPDGAPKGESVNMGGLSYSTCEQIYRKGDQQLKVQLVDYNGANALYAGATAMMSAGFSQDNDDEMMRGCDLGIPEVKGWETLQKKDKKASVALGVGDRFFVAVESTGQDNTDFVKAVAKNINLNALAKL
ncbi:MULTISPECIES: hypothetical protein [Hymenobacter]|uniref:Uncharacterized protein n=1 Tax=Hymenobacter jejuensis TaxID=2502781 RepID=A0A5B8A0L5_9BACT|nr:MULTISPECIES: hypothetical protein [Hymenobacter]MBC6990981.1 hypothetical protein [Hymenobacter sp. BT491]QDA60619.1 hypothetical protein FHG12_11130 [Hymenobacter jejuensis]